MSKVLIDLKSCACRYDGNNLVNGSEKDVWVPVGAIFGKVDAYKVLEQDESFWVTLMSVEQQEMDRMIDVVDRGSQVIHESRLSENQANRWTSAADPGSTRHSDLSLTSLYGAIRNNETDGDHQNLMQEIFAEHPGKNTVWTAEKISTSEAFILWDICRAKDAATRQKQQASSGGRTSLRRKAPSEAALQRIAADADTRITGKGKKKRARSKGSDERSRPGVICQIPSEEQVREIQDRMLGRISNGAPSRYASKRS